MLRSSKEISSLAALLVTFSGGPVAACVMATPPSCEATESEAACAERAQQWYAEQEAARLIYEKKSPAERALDEQTQLWDDNEIIFLARVEKIKLRGIVYPQPEPKAPKPRKGKIPPPLAPVLIPPLFSGQGHDALIRPIRQIKGPPAFSASWQYVGGVTSCGNTLNGALAYTYPGGDVIVFARWASRSRQVRGKWVSTDYLSLNGLNRDELVEPRIVAALAEALPSKTELEP